MARQHRITYAGALYDIISRGTTVLGYFEYLRGEGSRKNFLNWLNRDHPPRVTHWIKAIQDQKIS